MAKKRYSAVASNRTNHFSGPREPPHASSHVVSTGSFTWLWFL